MEQLGILKTNIAHLNYINKRLKYRRFQNRISPDKKNISGLILKKLKRLQAYAEITLTKICWHKVNKKILPSHIFNQHYKQ